MRSAGFGRRIVEPSGHELVLIPGQEAPSAPPELANRDELKEQIRTALMSRIDPSVAGRIARRTLRAEITKLVSEIATEQRIQLNEIEEAALATELTDDMVGLGPLEPLSRRRRRHRRAGQWAFRRLCRAPRQARKNDRPVSRCPAPRQRRAAHRRRRRPAHRRGEPDGRRAARRRQPRQHRLAAAGAQWRDDLDPQIPQAQP